MTGIYRIDVLPTDAEYIENTTMKKVFLDDVHKTYEITPNSGYVLHDKQRDVEEFDPDLGALTGNIILGHTRTMASCPANYDFTANPREFYAVPESEVPENQIHGGGGNNNSEAEVMKEGESLDRD